MPQCNPLSYLSLAAGLALFGYAGYQAYVILNTDIFPGFEDGKQQNSVETWSNPLNLIGGVFYEPADTSLTCQQVFEQLTVTWDCEEPAADDGFFTPCTPDEVGNFTENVDLTMDCVAEDIPEGDKIVRSVATFTGYISSRELDDTTAIYAPGKYTVNSPNVKVWAVWRAGEALKDLIGGAITVIALVLATCCPLCCGTIALCTSLFVFLSSSPPREQAPAVTTVQMTYMQPGQQQMQPGMQYAGQPGQAAYGQPGAQPLQPAM